MAKKFNGSKLKDMRLMAGKTLEEVAVSVDIDISSISLWENGRRPSPRNMKKIAEYFKVPISAFFLLVLMISPAHASVDRNAAITAIVGEAENQGFDGMTAVGEVIRRRGSVRGLYGYTAMKGRKASPPTWAAAERAWERSETSNLTKGATLFENIAAFGFPKSWDRSKVECVAQIGDHWFFVEE